MRSFSVLYSERGGGLFQFFSFQFSCEHLHSRVTPPNKRRGWGLSFVGDGDAGEVGGVEGDLLVGDAEVDVLHGDGEA